MNSPKSLSIERMIKHWVAYVPLPAGGRERLLAEAARRRRSSASEISWFTVRSLGDLKTHYYFDFFWPLADGIQRHPAVCTFGC